MPKSPQNFEQPPLGKTIPATFQSPKATDLFTDDVLTVEKDQNTQQYTVGKKGDPHPDIDTYPDHLLQVIIPAADGGNAKWIYTRVRPPLVSYESTNEGLVDIITKSRVLATDDKPELTALRVGARQENLADGDAQLTLTDEPEVFSGVEYSTEIPDIVPPEFRDQTPLITTAATQAGQAQPPILSAGELARSSKQVTDFRKRDSVSSRDLTRLPVIRHDYDIDGVASHGSVLGGIFDLTRTLSAEPFGQPVEEGFDIISSSVKTLAQKEGEYSITLRETKRLFGVQGASLLLTDPGSGFTSPPAVVFTSGNIGTDAAATANIAPLAENLGGTVELTYVSNGDDQGVFFFLGARGGGGTWRNPHTAGDITIAADGPVVGTLAGLVDRQPSNTYTDDSVARAFYFDLGAAQSLLCKKLSFRQRSDYGGSVGDGSFGLQGTNTLGVTSDWHSIKTVDQVPPTMNEWRTVNVPGNGITNAAYRRFRIIAPFPWFTIGEIELYGTLTFAPIVSSGNSVVSVTMSNGGTNYRTVPTVGFYGDGTGAAGTAVISGGTVTGVTMTNVGTGYTVAPLVKFFVSGGGKNAAITANLTADVVTSLTISNGGSEYSAVPSLLISGDGSGASATAVLTAGVVTGYTALVGGSGFTVPPTVTVTPAGGPVATATIGKGIQSIAVNTPGSAFSSPPAVQITGDGEDAQATATLGFPVESVIMTNRGSGYTSTPTAVFAGNGTVTAAGTAVRGFPVASVTLTPVLIYYATNPTVVVSGGGSFGQDAAFEALVGRPVLAIYVGAPGSNYDANPTVVITPVDTGSGAAATSVRSFKLASITIDAAGAGYTLAPEVVIAPPTGVGGIQATAHTVLTAGAVTAIILDNPGYGYLTAPTATIVGDSTGALCTPVIATVGAIDSIVMTTNGTNYSVPPNITFTLTGATGSGASASAALDVSGVGTVVKVNIVNPGFGYTSAPTLFIAGPTPVSATLSTTGQIVAVTMTSGQHGSGYTLNASISFSSGGGSGAAGIGTLTPGAGTVKSVTVVKAGKNFTVAPTIKFVPPSTATATATLKSTGSIRTLTLVSPGPDYTVAPLVSFVPTGATAAALYILATGWPILRDIITDPVEGIVVNIEKKIVPYGTAKGTGYIDILALDKYRSIQITSSIDVNSLPAPDDTVQTHVLSLPPLLSSVGVAFSRDSSVSAGIDTRFGSTSVKTSVRGKIIAKIIDGYRGPAKARVVRTFMFGAPTAAQTPDPLVITPSTGIAYVTSRHHSASSSVGVRGGFGYAERSFDSSEQVESLDISGVLTGGYGNTSDLYQTVNSQAISYTTQQLANSAFMFIDPFRLNLAQNSVTANANLIVDILPSCPRSLTPGTTFLLSAIVEKWRFGVYVQTLVYVTIPLDSCRSSGGGS